MCMGNTVTASCACCKDASRLHDQTSPGKASVAGMEEAMETGDVVTVLDPMSLARVEQGGTTKLPRAGAVPTTVALDWSPTAALPLESQSLHYTDGSTYVGQMRDGLREGHGVYTCATEQYEGEWLDDKPHGRGHQSWSDGRYYEGQFHHGKFSGLGKMVWQNPGGLMVYEGEYADDQKHGVGEFRWPDGRVYNGEWRRGRRHGRGAYTTVQGEQRIGYWSDDRFLRWETAQGEQDNVNHLLR